MTSAQRLAPFRLRGQRLDRRVPRTKLVETVGAICGLHAQLMSSAELELWVRLRGAKPHDLHRALWDDRTLVKTWLMRGTLHVVPAEDLPLYVAANVAGRFASGYLKRHIGVDDRELERVMGAIAYALDGAVLTRDELTREVERRVKGASKRPEPAWAWFPRLAAARGLLCNGPSRGRSVTFTRPDTWLRGWRAWDADEARIELLRRYLSAHGPASPTDFAWWLDMTTVGKVRVAWSALEPELEEAEPGRWILASDAKRLRGRGLFDRVRLLPAFDPALLGHKDRSHIVDADRYATIYRKAAWVTPPLLVDGRIAGTWSHEVKKGTVHVAVEPFRRLAPGIRDLIATEADSLGRFLGAEAALAIR